MLEMQRKYYFGGDNAESNEATTEQAEDDSSAKMPVVQVSANIGVCKPLDAIVELNYEASSDEELQV